MLCPAVTVKVSWIFVPRKGERVRIVLEVMTSAGLDLGWQNVTACVSVSPVWSNTDAGI